MFGVRRTRPFFSAPHLKKPLARNPGGLQPPLPRSGHPKRDASGRGIALALGRRKASFPVRPGRRRTSFGKRKSDPQTDVAPGRTRGRNVRSKNQCSMCPAIHTKSRSWLRSSSTREPSDPLLRVVFFFCGLSSFLHAFERLSRSSVSGEASRRTFLSRRAVRLEADESPRKTHRRDVGAEEAEGPIAISRTLSSSLARQKAHPLQPQSVAARAA